MAEKKQSRCQGILELDRTRLREVDGVVFDEDSYQRYVQHQAPMPPAAPAARDTAPQDRPAQPAAPAPAQDARPEPAPVAAPTPVFAVDPVHVGWYTTENQVVYPIMAGAIRAGEFVVPAAGSGSGSYSTSYLTSLSTSYTISFTTSLSGSYWYTGSGSAGSFGSFGSGFGSCAFGPGGYGLDLI